MFLRTEDSDGFVALRSSLLLECGVPHLFTTRRMGRSGEDFDVGALTPGLRERLDHALGGQRRELVDVRQVHGADVLEVGDGEPPVDARADALVASRPDRALLVRSADCVTVLLASEDGRVVAAAHAGWRGLVAGVLPAVVAAMGDAPLAAAVGPCLCREHFEVGPEVARAFGALGLAEQVTPGRADRSHVDLREVARQQLDRAAVPRLDVTQACTFCDPGDFYSYRRDVTHGGQPRTGRLAAVVAPRQP